MPHVLRGFGLVAVEFFGARVLKAKRGYSRDQRPDAKQVLVGLGINGDGFPDVMTGGYSGGARDADLDTSGKSGE